MQEAADSWLLNFSTARAVYVATASSNSASDSTDLPKDLAVMIPFFGLGSVSRGMHAIPRSSSTERWTVTEKRLRIQCSSASLRSLAVKILPLAFNPFALHEPIPHPP